MGSSSVSVIGAKAPNGVSGWRLRWTVLEGGYPVRGSCWFVEREEACSVRDLMRQGQTFEEAIRTMMALAQG